MKRFSLLFIQFAVMLTLLNCERPSRYPDDFRFKIDATIYAYNSDTQEYTRSYVKSDTTIRVALTEAEFQKIYDMVSEMRFLNFPREFEQAKEGIFTHPSFITSIEIGYGGEIKKCSVNSGTPKIEIDRPRQFGQLENTILKILSSKEEVRSLRESDLVFL